MVTFDENKVVFDLNRHEFLYPIYVKTIKFLVIWHHFDNFYVEKRSENLSKSIENGLWTHQSHLFWITVFELPQFWYKQLIVITFYVYYLQEKIYWRQFTWFWAIMHCLGNSWPFYDQNCKFLPKMVKNCLNNAI